MTITPEMTGGGHTGQHGGGRQSEFMIDDC